MFITSVLTKTKAQLYQKAWVNVVSLSARTKLLMPVNVASRKVVNWQKARYTPCMNGMMKPIMNAASGRQYETGHHFFMGSFHSRFSPFYFSLHLRRPGRTRPAAQKSGARPARAARRL